MSPKLSQFKVSALLFAALLIPTLTIPALGQQETRNSSSVEAAGSTKAKTETRSVPNPKYTTPSQPLDPAYGAKIAEYTTEKYFLTELVDHLPASDKVPSPDKVLGYVVGTPNKLTKTA